MAALRRSLPPSEWAAVEAWLSTFYPFQLAWLLDWTRFSICVKARQIGASHSYAAAAVLWGMLGETTTVVSVGEREALEVVTKARLHCEALTKFGSRWARPGKGQGDFSLDSGGRILALPATSGGRSFSGSVILDEFAYHVDPARVWDGAGGTVMHGYKLRVVSTPNGVGNLFHDLWTSDKAHAGYSLHSTTLDQARADGLRVDESECWKMARGDARVFDQLFRCSFLDNEQQYIPSALIDAAMGDVYCAEGDTFAGLDIGRTADLTVLVIVRLDEQRVAHVIHTETRKRTAVEDLEQLAALAFSPMFRARRLCVDSTGMGAFPAESLQKKFGRTKVEPVAFTLQSKEDLATTLYQRFIEQTIRIPRDADLRDDICALRRIVTSAGNIRYDAPHTDKGHADRAWALALALHGCSGPSRTKTVIHDYNEQTEAEWT